MRKMTFTKDGFVFAQVDKRTARAVYRSGLDIIFCPANLRPFTPWHCETSINVKRCDGEQFDDVVNAFEWYNCTNSETGRYTRFYIPVIDSKNVILGRFFANCYDFDYMQGAHN